jgi:hypothetical protein
MNIATIESLFENAAVGALRRPPRKSLSRDFSNGL